MLARLTLNPVALLMDRRKRKRKKPPKSKPRPPRVMICCNCDVARKVPHYQFLRAAQPRCRQCQGPLRRATKSERKCKQNFKRTYWTVPSGTRVFMTADGWTTLDAQMIFTKQPTTLGEKLCFEVGTQYMRVPQDAVTKT